MNDLFSLTALTAATTALALSDGTPVEFSKITSKGNIQVRIPESHPFAEGDPLKIFRRDGSHYKDATDLTLVIAEPATEVAASAPAPAAAAAAASNDNTVYEVSGMQFDSLDEAKDEALEIYDGRSNVEIVAITRRTVGVVGFTQVAA